MKKLLEYLIKNIIKLESFEISEEIDGDFVELKVTTEPGKAGLVIGKGGKTIKAIRNILKVKATLEKKGINISVEEK